MIALEGPLAGLPFVAVYLLAASVIVTVCTVSLHRPKTGMALCVAVVAGILIEGLPA